MSYADLMECEAEIQHLEGQLSVMKDRKSNMERELVGARAVRRCPGCDMPIRICADVPEGREIAHTQAECEHCRRTYYVHVRFTGGDRRDPANYHAEFVDAGFNIDAAVIGGMNEEELEKIYKAAVEEKRRRGRLGAAGLLFRKKGDGGAKG